MTKFIDKRDTGKPRLIVLGFIVPHRYFAFYIYILKVCGNPEQKKRMTNCTCF